jgi:hypothetical protein
MDISNALDVRLPQQPPGEWWMPAVPTPTTPSGISEDRMAPGQLLTIAGTLVASSPAAAT